MGSLVQTRQYTNFCYILYIQQTNITLNGGISKWLTRKIRNLLPPGACVQITLPSSSFINQFLIAKQTLLIVVEKWYLVRLITESSLDRNQAMIFSIFFYLLVDSHKISLILICLMCSFLLIKMIEMNVITFWWCFSFENEWYLYTFLLISQPFRFKQPFFHTNSMKNRSQIELSNFDNHNRTSHLLLVNENTCFQSGFVNCNA